MLNARRFILALAALAVTAACAAATPNVWLFDFGRLVLPFDPTANSVTGRVLAGETLYRGVGTLPFEVTNRRDEAVKVTVRVASEGGDASEVQATIGAGATERIAVPMRFDEPGEVRLTWDLLERPSGTVLYTTALAHIVPEALAIQPDHLLTWTSEASLTGRWRLGIAEGSPADVRLQFTLRAANDDLAASETLTPADTDGVYSVRIGDARAGTYTLVVRLMQGEETVAEREVVIERMTGPFTDAL